MKRHIGPPTNKLRGSVATGCTTDATAAWKHMPRHWSYNPNRSLHGKERRLRVGVVQPDGSILFKTDKDIAEEKLTRLRAQLAAAGR
jgi:hypothetical protein